METDDSRLESKSGKVLGETYMLKRTDSATMTKVYVTVAYTRHGFISLPYNCPRRGRTDLYGASVVSDIHTPFSMSFVHLNGFPDSSITRGGTATLPTFQPTEGKKNGKITTLY